MKVICLNANGIRAAAKKGVFEWLDEEAPDVVCLQETRAEVEQLQDEMFFPKGYECHYISAQKKGYSGVAMYSKRRPTKVVKSLGFELSDNEGRYLQIEYPDLMVASLYLPSGSSSPEKLENKYIFLDSYLPILEKQLASHKHVIVCGDFNIAHKQIDIKNWRANQKNSGFLPEERAWMDRLFDELGFIDAFRQLNQDEGEYTWWSNRGRAYDNNVGWRIDYQVVSPSLRNAIKRVEIYKERRFSDHAPLIIEYEIPK